MDTSLQALLSWQFMLFSLGIFAIVWMIRTIIEALFPKIVGKLWWQKVFLPIIPCFLGLIIAKIAKNYAYPDGLTTLSGRLLFGMVSGLFSGLIYQVIKGMLKNKIQTFLNPTYVQPVLPAPPPPTIVPPVVPVVPAVIPAATVVPVAATIATPVAPPDTNSLMFQTNDAPSYDPNKQ